MNPIYYFIPLIIASSLAVYFRSLKSIERSNLILALLGGGSLFIYAWSFLFSGEATTSEWWLQDHFSALLVLLIAFVYMASLVVGQRYIAHEYEEKLINLYSYKIYFSLFHLFALCMFLVVMTNNSLLLWLALEGTTLFSAFLVGLYRRRTSIEAAWKYMILCSTGISLGLVGILLLSYGASVAGIEGNGIFLLSTLMENAAAIPVNILKIAFVFIFIGFGTKLGLVPMHTWLPDAHSKAPSPISAIFSAVLLNVALYAILRFKFIIDTALQDPSWTNHLFLIFGVASVALAALMMLIQDNYKRMLAYSSIEHMGLMVFALALSPLGAAFGIIHMIGHTLTKSALFFGAGEILLKYKTTKISKLKNLLSDSPFTSVLFIVGILAIVAMPFSVLFVSEYGMLAQAITVYPKTSIGIFIALGIIAYAMLQLTVKMLFAKDVSQESKKEKWNLSHSLILTELVLVFILSYYFTSSAGLELVQTIVHDFLYIQ